MTMGNVNVNENENGVAIVLQMTSCKMSGSEVAFTLTRYVRHYHPNSILAMSSRQVEALIQQSKTATDLLRTLPFLLKTSILVPNPYLTSRLIHVASSISLPLAASLFRRFIPGTPPPFSWNTMIRSYANSPDPAESLKIFCQMRESGIGADSFTYPFVIMASGKGLRIGDGRGVHGLVVKDGFIGDKYVGGTLITMYVEFDQIVLARKVFDEMPVRDVTSWSSLIAAYVACDCPRDGLKIFQSMNRKNIKPNNVTLVSLLSACTYLASSTVGRSIHSHIVVNHLHLDSALGTALLSMYSKCGSIERAMQVFRFIEEKNLRCWTVMISCLAQHGRGKDAIALFTEVENSGLTPDSLTFTVILSCCSHSGFVDEGRKYFHSMKGNYGLEPSLEHYGCMVDMLGRAGLIDEAYSIIKTMPMEPNPVLLRSFIGSCRLHGQVVEGDDKLKRLLIEAEPEVGANYVLAANASTLSSSWSHAADARLSMKKMGLKKVPGYSWVEGVDSFVQETPTVAVAG